MFIYNSQLYIFFKRGKEKFLSTNTKQSYDFDK